ncbi:MAG TPA: hypothetical protein VK862_15390, partial [Afifellaceae bacterium]|nr:hypothetical protein [Afifellaceae bacterium]
DAIFIDPIGRGFFVRFGTIVSVEALTFQMTGVSVPKQLFQEILRLIDGLRARPAQRRTETLDSSSRW